MTDIRFHILALSDFVDINLSKTALRVDISEEFNDQSVITVPKTLEQMFVIVPSKLRFVTLVGFLLKIFNTNVSLFGNLISFISEFCFEKKKTDAKVLIFLATNDLVRFHGDVLNTMLNGEKDDDLDEEGDLKFGHLLKDPIKLLRLQGDMTHQVSF